MDVTTGGFVVVEGHGGFVNVGHGLQSGKHLGVAHVSFLIAEKAYIIQKTSNRGTMEVPSTELKPF